MISLKNLIIYSIFIISLITTLIYNASAQLSSDTTKPSSIKKGWKLGGILPALAYDSDIGFKIGILSEIYDYGKGEYFPDYKQKIYLEVSRTTKGSNVNQLCFDSKNIFGSNLRLIGEANYIYEQNLDFYGFNGYESIYNSDLTDKNSILYKSTMYYRYERKLFRLITDIQGQLKDNKLRWFGGYALFVNKIGSIDVNKLNKGKSIKDKIPSTDSVPGLYEQYVTNGIIPENQKSGGNINLIRFGLIADTRDNEACPMKGIWTEMFVQYSSGFVNNEINYSQFITTHRQYFTIIRKKLSFAYRLSYSQKLSGTIPFYMLPFYNNTFETRDGIGGAKTVRGILRNRIVGNGTYFGNFELRWKFISTKLFGQDFYTALNLFYDNGIVTNFYKTNLNPSISTVQKGTERLHNSVGSGLYFAINNNFIVVFEYGKALNKQDGDSGIYIHLGWLF